MSKPSVLLIGAGYVGGSVLDLLLKHGFPVSVQYRRPEQEETLRRLGAKPVRASLDDVDAIEEAVAAHDVLINTASSDHPASVEASIKGIQRRVDKGQKTVYIHTSGTGVLTDSVGGKSKSDKVFTDEDPATLESVDPDAPHRAIDKNLATKAAEWQQTGLVEARILLPPNIWGTGTGPFKRHSIQIPALVGASLKAKAAVVHGPGLAVWSHINVQDLAAGYLVLLQALLQGRPAPRTETDYYVFAEGGEFAWIDVSRRIGAELHARGLVQSKEPKQLSDKEALEADLTVPKEAWGLSFDYQTVGTNSRSRAWKLRQLGWEPAQSSTAEFLEGISQDVALVVADEGCAVSGLTSSKK